MKKQILIVVQGDNEDALTEARDKAIEGVLAGNVLGFDKAEDSAFRYEVTDVLEDDDGTVIRDYDVRVVRTDVSAPKIIRVPARDEAEARHAALEYAKTAEFSGNEAEFTVESVVLVI